MGAAGDDELHAVAVQSIQRIALADIYVVFELLGADIHRSCRDHLYDALLAGTLLAAETVLFLPALLDSALGEQFRDNFTGAKTAFLVAPPEAEARCLRENLLFGNSRNRLIISEERSNAADFFVFFSLFIG